MAGIGVCPQCGATLPAGVPDQPCPACLMRLGLESWAGRPAGLDPARTPTQISSGGFEAPTVEELEPKFPQLEVLELIGKGGMGAVYKARQKSLDRLVALKIINPDAGHEPDFAERFSREAKSLARLNHANIVTVHDFGEADGLYYFIMEYVDGANMRQLLRDRSFDPRMALQIVPPVCDALQYAHDEGIVHRDIKPDNILIDGKGRVKIADFGLAKLLGRGPQDVTLTAAHQAMGTLHYMAPEQMSRPLEVDHRADIYSLGVTLYEMLTGELPLGRFLPPSQRVQIDVRLDEVILKSLEQDPGRRYQHASDVKTDVQAITSSLATATADSATPAARATAPATSTAEAPWAEWWRGRPRPLQQAAHALPAIVYVVCLLLFFSFSGSRRPDEFVHEIGRPDPWLIVRQFEGAFKNTISLNSSLLFAVIGIAAILLERKLTRAERRAEDDIHWHVAIWACLLSLNSGVGFLSVVLHGQRLPVDRPGTAAIEAGAVHAATTTLGGLMLAGAAVFAWAVWRLIGQRGAKSNLEAAAVSGHSRAGAEPAVGSAVAGSSLQFAPGTAPKLLAIALSLLFGTLLAAGGLAMIAIGFVMLPESGARWGFVAGGGGTLLGGLGGIFGTWNSYRQFRGATDLMESPHWTSIDTVFLLAATVGLATAAVTGVYWSSLGIGLRITLLILGGIVGLQGIGFSAWRAAHRRAARTGPQPTRLDLRLVLVAGGILLGGLTMIAGLAMGVISLLYQPGGEAMWGAWLGTTVGCFFGGAGAMFGSWNTYRKMEGAPDVWASGDVTWFDRLIVVWGLIGLAALTFGLFGPAAWADSLRWATGLIGGTLCFQSLVFGVIRALTIRGARQERAASESERNNTGSPL